MQRRTLGVAGSSGFGSMPKCSAAAATIASMMSASVGSARLVLTLISARTSALSLCNSAMSMRPVALPSGASTMSVISMILSSVITLKNGVLLRPFRAVKGGKQIVPLAVVASAMERKPLYGLDDALHLSLSVGHH